MAKEYESPKAKRMNSMDKGRGHCESGSGDSGNCDTGNSAAEMCNTGNSPGMWCDSGNGFD